MRTRSTLDFIGLWEQLNNSDFKPLEFERFKNESGSNYFILSPQKWVNSTNAIGIISKSGRYGGTFAHKDITSLNSVLIKQGLNQSERLIKLNEIAISQMKSLINNKPLSRLKNTGKK